MLVHVSSYQGNPFLFFTHSHMMRSSTARMAFIHEEPPIFFSNPSVGGPQSAGITRARVKHSPIFLSQ